MSILNNSLLLGADAGGGGYAISRSLRFNAADSSFLSRTPASAGNRKTWTWAGWVKLAKPSNFGVVFDAGAANTDTANILVRDTGVLQFYAESSNTQQALLQTSQVLRDYSAWYHLVLSVDTTQATTSNRIKFYLNGSQITAFSTASYPSQNADLQINAALLHRIGRGAQYQTSFYFDGYLADVFLIDGQALTPSSFGEFDTNGIWQPKAYTGSYGTNGFHLPFSDNSAATATTLGKDTSGNGNNWTPNNLSVQGGNGNYIANLYTSSTATYNGSATDTNFYNGGISTRIKGFDGNLGTDVNSADVAGGWLYFRPSVALSSVTQLRVYASYVEEIRINGNVATVSPSVPATSTQWYSITSPPSTITEIAVKGHVGQSATGRFNAIEINGVILVDYAAGAGNDSLVDSPTNGTASTGGDAGGVVVGNYCTLNPLDYVTGNGVALSNGNLDVTLANGNIKGTIAIPSSGKWYFESTVTRLYSSTYAGFHGIVKQGTTAWSGVYSTTGADTPGIYKNGSRVETISGVAVNDIFGVAVNMDSLSLQIYKNGSTFGAAVTIDAATYLPYIGGNGNNTSDGSQATVNFGARPFAYAAPSGFKSLNTANLPTPTILKGSDYFDTKLYTGNGSTQTISGLGFSPDLVWIKLRSGSSNHILTDTVRGATKNLYSNLTSLEETYTNALSAFTTDGFSVGSLGGVNTSSGSLAAWCWDAGSSNSTNTQGSITSTVRANASAGFSIVTYTGTGSAATVGHGLGVAPSLIIVKARDNSSFGGEGWNTYHSSLPAGYAVQLNSTQAQFTGMFTSTLPTSTVFTLSTNSGVNQSPVRYVAYCFAPVAGYSAMGSVTLNASADGAFIYLGFRPKLFLLKGSDNTSNWILLDSSRDTYNFVDQELFPNLSNAESTSGSTYSFDFLSNGIKARNQGLTGTFIWAAFAENPFSIARAR